MLNCCNNFLLSSRGSSQFCHDKSLNVATFLLPFAFCFVATIALPSLVFSADFLALFASFNLDFCKIIILVKIP